MFKKEGEKTNRRLNKLVAEHNELCDWDQNIYTKNKKLYRIGRLWNMK